jgi:lipopolysaccharide heptosyltransferase II
VRPGAWQHARNLLCVRLDSIGDVLMTSPAIRAVKAADQRITLLTSPAGAEVARLIPEIDDVITYEAPWMKTATKHSDSAVDHAMVELLRAQNFDAAVIFTVFSQSPLPAAMLCYLADIPLRLAKCRENPYQLLTDWLMEDEPDGAAQHEVRRQLDLVASIGAFTHDETLSLNVPEPAQRRIEAVLNECGVRSDRPWYVLHPGASAPSRRYPAESFAAAAGRLALEDGWHAVITGDADERSLVEAVQLRAGPGAAALAGVLNLAEMAALIQKAPLLLTNNTGPAHMAAALGTPVVDIYAGTNPQHMPWTSSSRVIMHEVACAPCYKSVCPMGHHECLRAIPPDVVVQAARSLMYGEPS